jgi:hypothetical protein
MTREEQLEAQLRKARVILQFSVAHYATQMQHASDQGPAPSEHERTLLVIRAANLHDGTLAFLEELEPLLGPQRQPEVERNDGSDQG